MNKQLPLSVDVLFSSPIYAQLSNNNQGEEKSSQRTKVKFFVPFKLFPYPSHT